jgi:hypothetical protein
MVVSTRHRRKGTPLPRPLDPRLGGTAVRDAPGGGPNTLPSWYAPVPSLLRSCIHSRQITRGTIALSSVWRRTRARRQLPPLLSLAHATHEIQTLPVASEIEMSHREKISETGPHTRHTQTWETCALISTFPILPYLPKSCQPSQKCVT